MKYGQNNPLLSSLSESNRPWHVLLVLKASRHLQQQRLHYEWKTGAELQRAESLQQLFISIIHLLMAERRMEIMRGKTPGLIIRHRCYQLIKGFRAHTRTQNRGKNYVFSKSTNLWETEYLTQTQHWIGLRGFYINSLNWYDFLFEHPLIMNILVQKHLIWTNNNSLD